MKINYDPDVDILLLLLRDDAPVDSVEEPGGVIVSYGEDREPISVEFLNASSRKLIHPRGIMEKEEKFFTVLGLLFTKQMTLAKAVELLDMSREELSALLKNLGLEYSYLSREEVQQDKEAAESL
jgi:uncharacterized protein YuzE